MSEPEIARRCLSCGASVRGRASFCPQCGSRMNADPVASDASPGVGAPQTRQTDSLVDEAVRVANTLNDKLPTLSQESRVPGNHGAARQQQQQGEGQQQQSPTPEGRAEAFAAHALPPSEHEVNARATADVVAIPNAAPQGETREERETGEMQAAARGRMRERTASVGASGGGDLRPRMDKLREASTIVFDEAADDPGLRFVIVAVVLFVVFLFILLFSYLLG